jgi:hypothetical protein
MIHVLNAFRYLLGSEDKEITSDEFRKMWISCSEELKQKLIDNAYEMGFRPAV